MIINETQKRKDYLKFLSDAATASSETDMEPLLSLFNPGESTRKEMGDAFTEVLGWNPIRDFDINEINAMMEDILPELDASVLTAVKTKRKALVKRAMEIYEEGRGEAFKRCLALAGLRILDADAADALSIALTGEIVRDEEDETIDGDEEADSIAETMADLEDEELGISHGDDDDFMDLTEEEDDDE